MIIFRTRGSSGSGFGQLTRSVLLAKHLPRKIPRLFLIDVDRTAKRFLKENNLPFRIYQNPESIRGLTPPPALILFDLPGFSEKDLALVQTARVQRITTLHWMENEDFLPDVDFRIYPALGYKPAGHSDPALYTGARYFPLHPRYRHFHRRDKYHRDEIKKILIALGGSPPYRPLRRVIDPLYRHGYQLRISPGFTLKNNQMKTLRRLYPRIRWCGQSESLARAFAESDLAIITGVRSAYESACTGTHALYLTSDTRRQPAFSTFVVHGLGTLGGPLDRLNSRNVLSPVREISLTQRQNTEIKGKKLIDGRGLFRVMSLVHRIARLPSG